jgi:hypothetical protein
MLSNKLPSEAVILLKALAGLPQPCQAALSLHHRHHHITNSSYSLDDQSHRPRCMTSNFKTHHTAVAELAGNACPAHITTGVTASENHRSGRNTVEQQVAVQLHF